MRESIVGLLFVLAFGSAAGADPVEEQNKRTVSLIYTEILGKWRIEENEHIYSDEYVGHAGDQIIAEGDLVAVLWRGEGINTGEGNGLPATGKPFHVTAMTMFRLRDGKIVEEWNVFDNYAFLTQLGLLGKPSG
ncbi:MAG: ester cyclase [Steroidobacteraceae bacterium]